MSSASGYLIPVLAMKTCEFYHCPRLGCSDVCGVAFAPSVMNTVPSVMNLSPNGQCLGHSHTKPALGVFLFHLF